MSDLTLRNAGWVFQQGASAREAGVARFGNPYRAGCPEHFAWITGWRSADEELAERSASLGASSEPPPFDLSDFECFRVGACRVDVVFLPAARRYSFFRQPAGHHLALASPTITGHCADYEPEIVDCLARAIAHKAESSVEREVVRDTPERVLAGVEPGHR